MSKRKSSAEHRLRGTFRADRHEREAIAYPPADSAPPRFLSKEAKKEWQRVAPQLVDQGLLRDPDVMLLCAYCESVAGFRDSLADIAKNGRVLTMTATTRTGSTVKRYRNPACDELRRYIVTMRDCAAKFGFTPLDRARVSASESETTDDYLGSSVSDDDNEELYSVEQIEA